MTDKQTSPANLPDSGSGFLGGGPKFNQAGMNAPLPGEVAAEVKPQTHVLARLWIGVALVVILVAALWVIYGHQPSHEGRGGVGINSRPSDDPDAPPSSQ